jgi:hypothetical protein
VAKAALQAAQEAAQVAKTRKEDIDAETEAARVFKDHFTQVFEAKDKARPAVMAKVYSTDVRVACSTAASDTACNGSLLPTSLAVWDAASCGETLFASSHS